MNKEIEPQGRTLGAFGHKKKKAPVWPKHIGKRGSHVAREEELQKATPKKGRWRGK